MSKPVVYYWHTLEVENAEAGAKVIENAWAHGANDFHMQQIKEDEEWTGRYLLTYKTPKEDE